MEFVEAEPIRMWRVLIMLGAPLHEVEALYDLPLWLDEQETIMLGDPDAQPCHEAWIGPVAVNSDRARFSIVANRKVIGDDGLIGGPVRTIHNPYIEFDAYDDRIRVEGMEFDGRGGAYEAVWFVAPHIDT